MKTCARLTAVAVLTIAAGILPAWTADRNKEPACEVRVNTDPAGAMITCDGKLRDASPLVLTDLLPGEHLIVAVKEGYNETRKTFTLSQDQRLLLDLKMERTTGLVLIHSDPAGAEIKIDGVSRGKTPLFIDDLPPGIHRANMLLAGFQPKDIEINVADRSPLRISVNLASDSATLTVKSTPDGASVSINGIDRGKTPCAIDKVQQGEVTVDLTLDGCEPYHSKLKLTAGQTEEINVSLNELPAELAVISIPDKARVYVNNQARGQTPLTMPALPPGAYRVRVEQKGYEAMARDVTLRRAQKVTEEFRLVRNAGIFEITTEPAGVKVFIDGEEAGTTKAKPDTTDLVSLALTIDLLTNGKHQVQASKEGYDNDSFEITIEKDKSTTIHKKLKRKFIKDYWVRTPDTTYEGMLLSIDQISGDIKLELAPGIIRTVPLAQIRGNGYLKAGNEDSPRQ